MQTIQRPIFISLRLGYTRSNAYRVARGLLGVEGRQTSAGYVRRVERVVSEAPSRARRAERSTLLALFLPEWQEGSEAADASRAIVPTCEKGLLKRSHPDRFFDTTLYWTLAAEAALPTPAMGEPPISIGFATARPLTCSYRTIR